MGPTANLHAILPPERLSDGSSLLDSLPISLTGSLSLFRSHLMSLDIDWSLLSPFPSSSSSSPSSSSSSLHSLSTTLIDLLNRQLATTSRPSFIGPISVTSFDLGSTGPDIEIRDIGDVWRAFDEGDDEAEEVSVGGGGVSSGLDEDGYEMVSPGEAREGEWYGDEGSVYSGRGSVAAVGIGVGRPKLGRDYLFSGHGHGGGHGYGQGSEVPLSPSVHPHPHPHPHPSPNPSTPTRSGRPNDDPQAAGQPLPSLQLHLHLTHTSDLHLTLLTSLQVNYPSPLFMSLPLKLIVTGLTLSADLILAYSSDKHRVHLCVVDEAEDGGGVGMRLLPNLQIESEIGHADAHVLRNVGKVERFIADVVRKTLVDELVFPNFHTIAL